MKKIFTIFIVLAVFLSACTAAPAQDPAQAAEEVELIVFAAASLQETFDQIGKLFEEANPGLKVIFTFDSSGTLKTQIENGATVDVFVSAAQKQMNELQAGLEANTAGLDFVDADTRMNVVENKVALAVAAGNPANVQTFADLANENVKAIALGNADVPVGQYSEELLKILGIWDEIQPKVTYGSNAKEVTTWINEGVADCGIIYKTDAFSANLETVAEADGSLLKTLVIYPGAVMKNSAHPEQAKAFLDFLHTPEAEKILTAVGFSIPTPQAR
jgi:molybdate transport system substrate-binding protein